MISSTTTNINTIATQIFNKGLVALIVMMLVISTQSAFASTTIDLTNNNVVLVEGNETNENVVVDKTKAEVVNKEITNLELSQNLDIEISSRQISIDIDDMMEMPLDDDINNEKLSYNGSL